MSQKKLTLNQQIDVKIDTLGFQGEGIGDYDGKRLFVDGALPDEVVTIRVVEEKLTYANGKLLEIKKLSSFRVKPPCIHFDRCGGCQWMHVAYDEQLELKRKIVVNALARFDSLKDIPVQTTQPSPQQFHYRNKIQMPVSSSQPEQNRLKIGLYAKRSHHLVGIDQCLVHGTGGKEILESVKKLLLESSIAAYDPQTRAGKLRHLLIRSTVHTKEGLVIFVVGSKEDKHEWLMLANDIIRQNTAVKGVLLNFNDTKGNVVLGEQWELLVGRDYIEETVCSLRFRLSAASFFQINTLQAEQLYRKALEFAGIGRTDVVVDAFCGVGTMSLLAAQQAASVTGIEVVAQAIENAKINAQLNGITNARFICGKAEQEIAKIEHCDLLLINPPRKGCERSLLNAIGRIKPKKIVYVSCDPNTLARDLAILYPFGYSVDQLAPFDLFPHTSHVEVVSAISRKL